MSQVTVAFHPSVLLIPSAKGLDGTTLALERSWTVRQLAAAIERRCEHDGIAVRASVLINPARGRAAPPHEPASAHFNHGDRVVVQGDVRSSPWPILSDTFRSRQPGEPVPVTVFTGFLGAGKTTVLNHLLLGQREKKFAIIENEFGAVPIDNELLQGGAMGLAEQVVVMENGCMCCTMRGDLLGAFDSIRRQMEAGSPLDAVLIETTGMADPVPIVRTLRQTPDISRYFRLDGTITLVDTKTILARLSECEEDQERHRQIAFADRILLNKLDLVTAEEVVEVWHRIRSYNSTAMVVASVKGIVPPTQLTNLGAFDMDKIAVEEHGQGHEGHSPEGHGHECSEDGDEGHGNGHSEGHGNGHGDGHSAGLSHGLGHAHRSNHDSAIGSFSIVRKGVEVEPLAFARWVRVIATLPEAQGKLYRCKGVLAAAGRAAKLIFHAVADVVETSDGPLWQPLEARVCKIVFIGRRLARAEIEARFAQLLQPAIGNLRPVATVPTPPASEPATPSQLRRGRAVGRALSSRRPSLLVLAQQGLLHRALVACWTKDACRAAQASVDLRDALCGLEASTNFNMAARALPEGAPRGLHCVDGTLWLHALLPLGSVRSYARAWRASRTKLNTPCSGQYIWGEPLRFDDLADVEAAGVMWMECAELSDADTTNFVVEFRWRLETLTSFFEVPGSATNSTLVKITVEDPGGDSDMDDDLRFRVNLNPEQGEMSQQHRLSLQLVGGKSSHRTYQIFFHTIDPAYQVHVNVPDHRVPIFPTKEVFHQWHPLMNGLKRRPRLRFLLRLKALESGPLDAMCGCCG